MWNACYHNFLDYNLNPNIACDRTILTSSRFTTFLFFISFFDSKIISSTEIPFNSFSHIYVLKRKFKQWRSSIPPISTKRTTICYLNWPHWTQIRSWHMALEIQVLAWDRHKNVAVLNRPMRSQPRRDIRISNGNTNVNKR